MAVAWGRRSMFGNKLEVSLPGTRMEVPGWREMKYRKRFGTGKPLIAAE